MRKRISFIYKRKKKKGYLKTLVVFALILSLVSGQGLFAQIAKNVDIALLSKVVSCVIPLEQQKPAALLSWQKIFIGFDLSNPLTIIQNNGTIANAAQYEFSDKPTPAPTPGSTPAPQDSKPIKEVQIKSSGGSSATSSEGIVVKNDTSYSFDLDSLINEKLKFKIEGNEPSVLIIHSHTSEAYTPTDKNFYLPSDPDRTEDPNFNVVRVGDELASTLEKKGVSVLHDKTLHDYPSYNGSYKNSLATVEKYLKQYPSIKIVLDIHRDAMVQEDGTKLKVCTDIEGKKTAQIMIVTGTDQGGLKHPEWQENLKFSLKLQRRANLLYPNLMRPVNLRKERFNTHTTYGSVILEMGSNGNTLEEALNAAKCMGNVLADLIQFI